MKLTKYLMTATLSACLGLVMGCGSNNTQTAEAAESSDAQSKSKGFLGNLIAKPEPVTVAAGTPVTIRLESSLSSATAQPGDTFGFTLVEPLVVNGRTVANSGTSGVGRVVAARKSGRLHNSGYLRIAMSSLEIDGKQVPVQSSSIFVSGGRYVKRNVAIIGGSTAGGALIGGLAGGGKGALIGSAIGAGAGTGAAAATGKKDVGFSAERALVFKITQPLTVEI
jgi:outer membrane lipoprotein SlyB